MGTAPNWSSTSRWVAFVAVRRFALPAQPAVCSNEWLRNPARRQPATYEAIDSTDLLNG